jgi:uncharacterized damage-inducible protein DinB
MLRHLQNLPSRPDRAVQLFAHVLSGIKVWLVRVNGKDSSDLMIWPNWTLAECEAELEEVEQAMSVFIRSAEEENLAREIAYTNQHGLAYTTSIGDILFHLACHGAYHRGQICLVLRMSDLLPVNTDFITFVREMAGQPWKS